MLLLVYLLFVCGDAAVAWVSLCGVVIVQERVFLWVLVGSAWFRLYLRSSMVERVLLLVFGLVGCGAAARAWVSLCGVVIVQEQVFLCQPRG